MKEKLFEKAFFEEPEKEKIFFEENDFEHGKESFEHAEDENEHEEKNDFENAVFAFANALGRKPEKIFEILEKGSKYDELSKEFGEVKNDTEIFEKLAELRGIPKEEMKNEILWAIKKATLEKAIGEIMETNPGMNRETAKELANFRIEAGKAKEEVLNEEWETKLSELETFLSEHSGEGIEKLAGKVVEEWEGGIPLEAAFEKHRLFKENEKLLEEIEKLKNEQIKEAQKIYAREHSTGSATSAAGIFKADEFAEGLFKEY